MAKNPSRWGFEEIRSQECKERSTSRTSRTIGTSSTRSPDTRCSDLWPYRGLQPIDGPTPMGHEYGGIVEEVGNAVKSIKPHAIRGRVVCDFRQHLSKLPVRLPVLLHSPGIHAAGAGAVPACGASGQDARADAGGRSFQGPRAEPARSLGRIRSGLVRRRCRQGKTRWRRRCCRRRSRRPSWRALGQTDGSGAHYRDEPTRCAAEARP
jgi:hypothetical protein